MDIDRFKRLPVLGILRGGDLDSIEPLVETALEAGLEALEITLNTPNAYELLRRAAEAADGRLMLGAGTVLTAAELEQALAAGATFAVSPVLVEEVVAECRERGVPVFPGALTPQEIHAAWRAGATMVKVFPAKFFGPAYFQEIHGPFADIGLLACGGVSDSNAREFFAAGASAIAFGASIFRPDWLAAGEFARIGGGVRRMVEACRQALHHR